MNKIELLKNATYKEVSFFNFNNFNTYAKCVKLYDGDTGTFAFYYGDILHKFRIRLAHIDAPEIKSKKENEVIAAYASKLRLNELIGKELVYLECFEYDKYGRILANIYKDENKGKSFNSILLEEGHAKPYSGGKKEEYSPPKITKMDSLKNIFKLRSL